MGHFYLKAVDMVAQWVALLPRSFRMTCLRVKKPILMHFNIPYIGSIVHTYTYTSKHTDFA